MAPLTRNSTILFAAILTLHCGTPLVDTNYIGAPLLTVQGQVFGSAEAVDVAHPQVRIALFWSTIGLEQSGTDDLSEQSGTGVNIGVPLSFSINVFTAPPTADLTTLADGKNYGAGRFAAYVDSNGNGKRDSDEPFVGLDPSHGVLYSSAELTEDESPTGDILPAGFHLASLPLSCAVHGAPPFSDGGSCGVPLGAPCQSDMDCTGGVCLTNYIYPWPHGSCAIPDPPPAGCMPGGVSLVRGPPDAGQAFLIEACSTDSDCNREFPYVCDLGFDACLPTGMLSIAISDSPQAMLFCAPAMGDGGMPPPPDGGMMPPDGGMQMPCTLPDGGLFPPPMDGGPPMPDGGGRPPPPCNADAGMP